MTSGTILLLMLSAAVAAGLSYVQYFYKNPNRPRIAYGLAALRFAAIFGLLLLLINPVISRTSYETVKIPLPVVVDNSRSVKELNADGQARAAMQKLLSDGRLSSKFEVQAYRFDADFEASDKADFSGAQTRVDLVAQNLRSIDKNSAHPIVLITDGNQTHGSDYVYSFRQSNRVFPIVLGDTTKFLDLRISRLNVNKYAFLKNQFPAEVFLQYNGNKNVSATFSISNGATTLARQTVNFSPQNRAQVVNVLLPANTPGLQVFRASVTSAERERNTFNNQRNFAVEIIDQKTEVGIVSSLNHPDLGALKRAIGTKAQRRATIVKPGAVDVGNYNVLILYQPDASFRSILEQAEAAGVNTWIITGMSTDFNLLNRQQDQVSFRMSGQKEDYLAAFDSGFNFFAAEDIGFAELPPLDHPFGVITAKTNLSVLLQARIRNIDANQPLLAFAETGPKRTAYLFGENIWKWRLQSHANLNSFEKFDQFVDKTIQFLASNQKRRSLVVDAERFYNSGDPIEISAQFFNKNFEFDEKARLSITVTNRDTKAAHSYDMIRATSNFKVNLDRLSPGKYSFLVKELTSNATHSGFFEVIDFDIEKQFVNPDVDKLRQLSAVNSGAVFMPDQTEALIRTLVDDPSYKPIEKEVTRRTPIIDWLLLLILIASALGAEWLLRKYHGML